MGWVIVSLGSYQPTLTSCFSTRKEENVKDDGYTEQFKKETKRNVMEYSFVKILADSDTVAHHRVKKEKQNQTDDNGWMKLTNEQRNTSDGMNLVIGY